jgi:hypothetical protein
MERPGQLRSRFNVVNYFKVGDELIMKNAGYTTGCALVYIPLARDSTIEKRQPNSDDVKQPKID